MYNNDVNIRHKIAGAPREFKASANYAYVVGGITLDGSKFSNGELILNGQCLVMDNVTKKYEKYADGAGATFPAGKSNPVILDETVKFEAKDDGSNPDLTAGQVITWSAGVYEKMLIGCTAAFKTATQNFIRYM